MIPVSESSDRPAGSAGEIDQFPERAAECVVVPPAIFVSSVVALSW